MSFHDIEKWIEAHQPPWEKRYYEGDYEDFEDTLENIAGAEPGFRYGT